MTGETIRTAGRCLYGKSWRYPFQVDFGVGGRSLQRMLKGDHDMDADTWGRVLAALRERHKAITGILAGTP